MKILITTDLYTTKTNGVVTSVQNLTTELLSAGHDVRILTFSNTRRSRREENVYYLRSVSLERVYPDVRMPVTLRHKYIRELIAWKPDVIHSQCEFFSFHFARRISKRTGAPIVHTYHTLYEQYVPYLIPSQRLGEYLVKKLSRWRLKKVDTIIAPTRKVQDTLQGYGVRNPIRVIPSGIELDQHKNRLSAQERSQARQKLGITDDQMVLLNLGRLGEEKNLDELLQLFHHASKEIPNLVFLIVGDGPARAELERTARELGLQERVIFTGMVPPDQVQNYYQLADIFVSASTSETQGLTYVEAAANGLPLVCRQDTCLDGILVEGEDGFAFTNIEEFTDSIQFFLENPEQRMEAGRRSAQLAQAYDCETFGKNAQQLYTDAVERSAAAQK